MQSQHTIASVLFRTPRLLARRVRPGDAVAMHQVYGDEEAMRWVGDGNPLDLAQCRHWIEVTLRNYATRGYGMFALIGRDSGEVAGFCGLVHPGGQPEAEVKYAFRRESWGQGLATEAASALISFGHSGLGLQRLIATIAPENIASRRVLLKAGMQPGPLRQNDDGSLTQLFVWQTDAGENTP